jgi:hypothetical protein
MLIHPSSFTGLAWFCTRRADYPRLVIWIIDAFPSPQRGFQLLPPLSSLCYEGNYFVISFASPGTSPSSLIRIAIWGRDMRIVVLTGSFFLANLAGLFYGKGFSVSGYVTGVLILLFIALNKVNSPSPYPNGICFRSANTGNHSGSYRMVTRSAGVFHQPHAPIQVEHYDQLCWRLCFVGGYAFWSASQAEYDASVGTVMSTRPVLDSRGSFDGAAIGGVSFTLFAMLRSVHSVNALHLAT